MSPLTRRQLIVLGAAGAGTAAVGGAGLWWSGAVGPSGGGTGWSIVGEGGDLAEPDVLASKDGLLELELEAAPVRVEVGGRRATLHGYNGSVPGPTLRLRPGDTVRVRLRNGLADPTNLHVHGLHVSPQDNGDNPFVSVEPGDEFAYEFVLPDDHAPGTYWYHPHRHGFVAEQLAAGLYGAIVVEEPEPVEVARERVLVVSDLSLDGSGTPAEVSPMEQMMGREGELVLVNGRVGPRLVARPGQLERWRIINACPSRFLRLRLDGQRLRLLGRGVGRLVEPVEVDAVDLVPGSRVELLVETLAGEATLVAEPVDRGDMGGMMGSGGGTGSGAPIDLLGLEVSGDAVPGPAAVPAGPSLRDLRQEPVTARRTLEFAMGMGGAGMGGGMGGSGMMAFTINGRQFGADRVDTTVASGSVEEWTLTNPSPMDHPVHLHVWPMQVLDGAGGDRADPTWQDVVNVPAGGQVTVRIAFDDFEGRTVYHCHVLDHEDLGMMGTIEAV